MSSRAIIGNIAEANLTEDTPAAIPTKSVWTGRIITGLVVPFLLVDAVGHLVKAEAYIEAIRLSLGIPLTSWYGLGSPCWYARCSMPFPGHPSSAGYF